jgi:hypothetical protein
MGRRDHLVTPARWLEPLWEALDRAKRPVKFFFRDDDIGWGDDRLFPLLDVFAHAGVDLDLAVIPMAVTSLLAERLLARAVKTRGALGFHQHGLAHLNHESRGKKCEFGPSRPIEDQRADIVQGRERMHALLGSAVTPIFSPPWNRCTEGTVGVLENLGFVGLSCDAMRQGSELAQLPVTVDFCLKPLEPAEARLGSLLSESAQRDPAVGVMLHHAQMSDDRLARCRELIELIASHPNARCCPMAALAYTHRGNLVE